MIKRIVIVPARGGSKRFPNKNKILLNNKSLIMYTIDVVKEKFDYVLFTSDSQELIDIVDKNKYSNVITNKRPSYLATDTSKVIDTVNFYYNINKNFNQIWLALPTCPLRTKKNVEEAQNLLTKDLDSVISITDFEFPPTLGLIKDDNNIITENNPQMPFANNNTRSQDHNIIYRPNGALYGSWWKSFGKNKNFFKGKVKGYYMPRERSVDIDNEIDLKWAQFLLNNNK